MPLIYHVCTMYVPCIYHVYVMHIYADIACTSCFQGFVALIAQMRLPLMAQQTTCQTNTMRLIFISPIHNQCWKDSCPIFRSRRMMNTCHYLSSSTVFQPQLFRANNVLWGYVRQLLPIQYGTPSISGKKCQDMYIYMVYVMYITCICL